MLETLETVVVIAFVLAAGFGFRYLVALAVEKRDKK
jgi:hypothetical protein